MTTKAQKDKQETEHKEFGGLPGVVGLMIFSHCVTYYFWYCIEFKHGALAIPLSVQEAQDFLTDILHQISVHAVPDAKVWTVYIGFFLMQLAFAAFMPGVVVEGLPLPFEGGKKLKYLCNAYGSWLASLAVGFGLHFSGVLPLTFLIDNYPRMMTAAMIVADAIAVFIFVAAHLTGNTYRMTGDILYDFFMGASLNPRLGNVDMKMFAEGRLSWILFYYITISCVMKQYEELGYVSSPMVLVATGHWLYANAVMKGEECITTTWDIFYEKWGWMLIYWNLAGVPFIYSLQSVYLYKVGPTSHPWWYLALVYTILFTAYYIWDTANSQKNYFRMELNGSFRERLTFPQLPWRKLKNPKYLKTEAGSALLVDGWWKYARKIHYTTDITMATCWGLACGFGSFIPYFYCLFFTCALTHRTIRDMERCSKKYGQDWVRYCKEVPYIFIPGVF